MAFELPALPYAKSALGAKGMCEETLDLHHGKHHQAYVTALNGFVEKDSSLQGKSLEDIVKSTYNNTEKAPVFNNAGQHWNHIIFWENMSPNGGRIPGKLEGKINSDFGSVQKFKDEFKAAGVSQFGSGWAWLVHDGSGLAIVSTPNQDSPISDNKTPLLGVDVWEHAYYLKYQNRRPDYLDAWWNTVNWAKVAEGFSKLG